MENDKLWIVLKAFVAKIMLGTVMDLPSDVILTELVNMCTLFAPEIKEREQITDKITSEDLASWLIDFNLECGYETENMSDRERKLHATIMRLAFEGDVPAEVEEKIQNFEKGVVKKDLSLFTDFLAGLGDDEEK